MGAARRFTPSGTALYATVVGSNFVRRCETSQTLASTLTFDGRGSTTRRKRAPAFGTRSSHLSVERASSSVAQHLHRDIRVRGRAAVSSLKTMQPTSDPITGGAALRPFAFLTLRSNQRCSHGEASDGPAQGVRADGMTLAFELYEASA